MEGQKPRHPLKSLNPESDSVERRLLPRLALSAEQFRLSTNGKIFGVADLCATGMAITILDANDRNLFPVGTRFEGTLNLDHSKHKLTAVVRNLRGDHVGCEFVELGAELVETLGRWLDPVKLGESMRPMPSGKDSDFVWYNGRSGTEILAWPDGKHGGENLRKVWVVLWGREFVEWDVLGGVRTGTVKFGSERDSVQGVLRWTDERLTADSRPDPAKLNLAKTIVLSSKLPEQWKARVQQGLMLPA